MALVNQPLPYGPPLYSTIAIVPANDRMAPSLGTPTVVTSSSNQITRVEEIDNKPATIFQESIVNIAAGNSHSNSITEKPYPKPLIFADTHWYYVSYGMGVRIGDRLIYDFEKISMKIGDVTGLHPNVKNEIPMELSTRRISNEQWFDWMNGLNDVQKISPSVTGCLLIHCFPGMCLQAILCSMLCPISSKHRFSYLPCCLGDWYELLQQWMENVNETLDERGLHAKLLTYKPFQTAPKSKLYAERIDGKGSDYEMSFLVIALTPAESDILKCESWDHGVNDSCTSGIGRCL